MHDEAKYNIKACVADREIPPNSSETHEEAWNNSAKKGTVDTERRNKNDRKLQVQFNFQKKRAIPTIKKQQKKEE